MIFRRRFNPGLSYSSATRSPSRRQPLVGPALSTVSTAPSRPLRAAVRSQGFAAELLLVGLRHAGTSSQGTSPTSCLSPRPALRLRPVGRPQPHHRRVAAGGTVCLDFGPALHGLLRLQHRPQRRAVDGRLRGLLARHRPTRPRRRPQLLVDEPRARCSRSPRPARSATRAAISSSRRPI